LQSCAIALGSRRVTAQNKSRGEHNRGAFDGGKTAGGHIRDIAAVEIIKRPLFVGRQLHIARTIIHVCVSHVGENLLHPSLLLCPVFQDNPDV
jgi:hypothetical protein